MLRNPAVAGFFYPSDPDTLWKVLDSFIDKSKGMKGCIGGISPHAGYEYSGKVAGALYSVLSKEKPETVVIMGPNHTGIGAPVAVYPRGWWRTPLGEVEVDSEFVSLLPSFIERDPSAHSREHSIEVQIPFIQKVFPNAKIVPICFLWQEPELAEKVGEALLKAEKESGKNVLYIASSDFSHYEPENVAREKDSEALRKIMELDISGFYDVLLEKQISVCGPGPIAALMKIVQLKNGCFRLIRYATSGDITGDSSSVVGYAAVVAVEKK